MSQMLPDGAVISPVDMSRIMAELVNLSHAKAANASLMVRVNLHLHYDYPKHVTVGDSAITVRNAREEANVLAGRKADHRHAPLPTKAHMESIGARFQTGSQTSPTTSPMGRGAFAGESRNADTASPQYPGTQQPYTPAPGTPVSNTGEPTRESNLRSGVEPVQPQKAWSGSQLDNVGTEP